LTRDGGKQVGGVAAVGNDLHSRSSERVAQCATHRGAGGDHDADPVLGLHPCRGCALPLSRRFHVTVRRISDQFLAFLLTTRWYFRAQEARWTFGSLVRSRPLRRVS